MKKLILVLMIALGASSVSAEVVVRFEAEKFKNGFFKYEEVWFDNDEIIAEMIAIIKPGQDIIYDSKFSDLSEELKEYIYGFSSRTEEAYEEMLNLSYSNQHGLFRIPSGEDMVECTQQEAEKIAKSNKALQDYVEQKEKDFADYKAKREAELKAYKAEKENGLKKKENDLEDYKKSQQEKLDEWTKNRKKNLEEYTKKNSSK